MANKKKVGSAGRYGSRYGRNIRKAVTDIEVVQRASHECPSCRKVSVRRVAFGIWQCRSCGRKFAGGAFRPVAHVFEQSIVRNTSNAAHSKTIEIKAEA
ncbi:MAG: 50S ribosomal protein L37ae [Candidatus Aenigmarchaeota archaeon]|nr:50S ribosomal protein L37ae [Candidatus Aenigmarchaeota archaeon]